MMDIVYFLCLLTSFALNNFNVQAKVVNSFNECKEFFYKGKEPKEMDQNAKKICQKLTESDIFLYASLYSSSKKIPLYSAYKFNPGCSGTSSKKWLVEPQLISLSEPEHMMPEDKLQNKQDQLKKTQAINSDYEETGYDRGHLYPNSFQCGDDRQVTFTLTNAAPMDPCFNRIHWKLWEGYLQSFLKNILKSDNEEATAYSDYEEMTANSENEEATAYIVTGTVPGEVKIPERKERVTVPTHIWTAVCYEHKDSDKSSSFGYIALNQPEFDIKLMSVSKMNKKLSELYKIPNFEIFQDDCFSDKPASKEAINQFLNLITLPQHKRRQMKKKVQNSLLAVDHLSSDSEDPANKPIITDLSATISYGSSSYYLTSGETLKRKFNTACAISGTKKRHTSDKPKRSLDYLMSESIECRLVPEKSVDGKTAADGSLCSRFENNGRKCTCLTQEGISKACCSSPCLYQDQLKDYRCYSGKTQIQCSPQYSLITATGNRCRDDHPCATYGKDYYWCFTSGTSWEYCSPPLWGSRTKDGKYCRSNFACAKYDKSDPWCYTDEKSFNSCCTSDDYFSAVNYKTCKPEHPCGYYGKNYLWCNTTDGRWSYCCKEFKK